MRPPTYSSQPWTTAGTPLTLPAPAESSATTSRLLPAPPPRVPGAAIAAPARGGASLRRSNVTCGVGPADSAAAAAVRAAATAMAAADAAAADALAGVTVALPSSEPTRTVARLS